MKVEQNSTTTDYILWNNTSKKLSRSFRLEQNDCFIRSCPVSFGKKVTENATTTIKNKILLGGDIHKRPIEEIFLYLTAASPVITDIKFTHNSKTWNPLKEMIAIDSEEDTTIEYAISAKQKDKEFGGLLSKMLEAVLLDPNSEKANAKKIIKNGAYPIVYDITDTSSTSDSQIINHYTVDNESKKIARSSNISGNQEFFDNVEDIPYKLKATRQKEATARNLFTVQGGDKYKRMLLKEAEKEAEKNNYNNCAYVYFCLFKEGPYKEKLKREESVEQSLLKMLGLKSK